MYAYLLQWFVSAAEKLSASRAQDENAQLGPNGKKASFPSPIRDRPRRVIGVLHARANRRASVRLADCELAPVQKTKSAKAPKKRKDDFIWEALIPEALGAFQKALSKLRTERIWQTAPERDTYISYVL